MDLAILKPGRHKTLIRQGVISDAFIKSKYDIDVLTITRCQLKLPNFTSR